MNPDAQSYWLTRAADALGHYLAAGGTMELIALDGALLVKLPADWFRIMEPAIQRGGLMGGAGVEAYADSPA